MYLSRSGQYLWHLTLPRSTTVVSMMMRGLSCSHVMYQNSGQVWESGPCTKDYIQQMDRPSSRSLCPS